MPVHSWEADAAPQKPWTRNAMTCFRIRVVFVPLLWCSFLALPGPTHAQTKKPNILVIMGDDIGWHNPGCGLRASMWTK